MLVTTFRRTKALIDSFLTNDIVMQGLSRRVSKVYADPTTHSDGKGKPTYLSRSPSLIRPAQFAKKASRATGVSRISSRNDFMASSYAGRRRGVFRLELPAQIVWPTVDTVPRAVNERRAFGQAVLV